MGIKGSKHTSGKEEEHKEFEVETSWDQKIVNEEVWPEMD